jgi:ubiquinol-cytochrome c reductase cytochrome b subunit
MRLRHGQEMTADDTGLQERGAVGRFQRRQRWLDERLGTSGLARRALRVVFPDHWSFLLG